MYKLIRYIYSRYSVFQLKCHILYTHTKRLHDSLQQLRRSYIKFVSYFNIYKYLGQQIHNIKRKHPDNE